MEERWRPISGFEGLYEVSDQGRVRSLGRTQQLRNRWGGTMARVKPPKILKPVPAGRGGKPDRVVVGLFREDGSRRLEAVHLLVLETFVGPRPSGLFGCHEDDDVSHNALSNVYWGTPSQNGYDASRNGRNWQTHKTHCKNGHEFTPENTIIRKDNGCRQCRTCGRIAACEYRRRVT